MLKVLVLAPGRSGTTTLADLVQRLCRANHSPWRVQHQTEQGPLTRAARKMILDGNPEEARKVLLSWEHEIEVSGNQNAFLVPVFQQVFGPQLKVIRLRRDPESHLASFLSGPRLSPEVWGGYHDATSTYEGPIYWELPTAVWFDEMTQLKWDSLTTPERVRWYLETLQRRMDEGADSFHRRLDLRTEELSKPETVDRVAQFLDPTWTNRVAPSHKNVRAMYAGLDLSDEEAREVKRLWTEFDVRRVLADPVYFVTYAIDRGVEHAADPDAFLKDLARYVDGLRERCAGSSEVRALKRRLATDASDALTFGRLIQALLQAKDPEAALSVAAQWVENNPTDAEALQLAAEAAELAGFPDRADDWREIAGSLVKEAG